MIRINLLPVRAAKKKETAVQQIVLAGVAAAIVALIVTSLYLVKRVQISTAKSDISAANTKINELKTKIGKLEELKTLKTQVKQKLDVLSQLRKNKMGPAQRLATLSDSTPDQLWLTGYNEKDSDIRISGIATTEELIATFMKSLESSNDFMAVELVVSEQTESAGTKLKKFEITMKLETPTATLPSTAAKN
jgi:type IV pilus assembly protein PilN